MRVSEQTFARRAREDRSMPPGRYSDDDTSPPSRRSPTSPCAPSYPTRNAVSTPARSRESVAPRDSYTDVSPFSPFVPFRTSRGQQAIAQSTAEHRERERERERESERERERAKERGESASLWHEATSYRRVSHRHKAGEGLD